MRKKKNRGQHWRKILTKKPPIRKGRKRARGSVISHVIVTGSLETAIVGDVQIQNNGHLRGDFIGTEPVAKRHLSPQMFSKKQNSDAKSKFKP